MSLKNPGQKMFAICGICTGTNRREGTNKTYYEVSIAVGKKIWGVGIDNDAEFGIFQAGGTYSIIGEQIFGTAEATGGTDNFGRPKAKVTQLNVGGLRSVKRIENGVETEVLPPKEQQASGGPSRQEVNAAYAETAAAAPAGGRTFLGRTKAAA